MDNARKSISDGIAPSLESGQAAVPSSGNIPIGMTEAEAVAAAMAVLALRKQESEKQLEAENHGPPVE
jgi:hypothetical protein